MDYTEYYAARDEIIRIVTEDLLGPVEENEILNELPVSYYLVGKLYPRNIRNIAEEQVTTENDELFQDEETLAMGNSGYPSAVGLTFSIDRNVKQFTIEAGAAYYEFKEDKEIKTVDGKGNNTKLWQRKPVNKCFTIVVSELLKKKKIIEYIHDKLFLQVSLYDCSNLADYKIIATIVNDNVSMDSTYTELSKNTYFQPRMIIDKLEGGKFCELYQRNNSLDDVESIELELLYHDVKSFSVGHGCSSACVFDKNGNVSSIEMKIMPEHPVLQMKPTACMTGKFLSMKFLSEASLKEITNGINSLCNGYNEWINGLKNNIGKVGKELSTAANNNINKCLTALQRLKETVNVLQNEIALKAFQLANKAMFLQRKATNPSLSDDSITWYPFQLAFFLMEIEPLVNPKSENRKKVDLLWFPTGGGKTEAYLGISAFAIFYRRLIAIKENREDVGVVAFMRYTLRLLSFQQFERASSMICAAEYIRRENNLGQNSFGIGLWAGESLTPNILDDAEAYLRGKTTNNTNPVQMKKCPWCGSRISANDYYVDKNIKRMFIRCPNENCDFHDGLPIHLVDEDIYAHKPSFIVGTIDKFAQIAFKEEAGCLLGVDLAKPPELIIQDELHLISGPLGTITGLYEAAITKLCEKNGIKPKIIASTATIRNAENQIKSLYGTTYEQFPPQGLSIKDSYFAEISTREEKAERDYVGVFSAGSSRALTFTRTAASLLFATRYLLDTGYSEEVIDSFWTQTGYFNTLKELGSALIRIVDSVQDRFKYLKESKFSKKYPTKTPLKRYDRAYEMTSRNSSADLGNAIQNELTMPFKKDSSNNPYDFLIASNMISVGVDVPRLNNMLVVGQPIKTSEYIQATSRVGRRTPGLVLVLYLPSFSRDRSHYEQFEQYHSSLYKYVEATSLTPFADRARDRALQALYVILCRYLVKDLRSNKDAKNYKSSLPGLEKVRNYIFDYVSEVDPEELENVKNEIAMIESEWEHQVNAHKNLIYYKAYDDRETLYKKDIDEGSRFRMMNSMRSVEPTIEVEVLE